MKQFNLDKKNTGWSVYVGGMFGAGKTTLLGDMLKYESQFGPVAYVMTPTEGDEEKGGWKSLEGLGLGENGYYAETYEDLKKLQKKFVAEKFRAIGLDTLVGFSRLMRIGMLGEDRMCVSSMRKNEYNELYNEFQAFTRLWNNSAYFSLAVAPTDLTYKDDQTGTQPDMKDLSSATAFSRAMMDYQKMEFLIPGLFDLCFHIECQGVKKTISRTLITQQGKQYATKQRLPKEHRIEKNIVLEDDLNNWSRVVALLPKEK